MIEKCGQVVAVEGQLALVETVRQSVCQACTAKHACGHGLRRQTSGRSASYLDIRALCDIPVNVGDSVVIGISESAMLQASFWVYLVPLLLFVAAMAFGYWLGLSELVLIVISFLALSSGFFLTASRFRKVDRQRPLHPVVLERERI
ncbi:MAG: SoxR reducing system RseC family protein [Endozoicomonadaceae bacterium]|nr:SoxR reducing system RseC family protein [Endozoicomonadaceae bacterium]